MLAFHTVIKSRRLYLDPRLIDNNYLLIFKRGLKTNVRNRIEIIPDTLVPSIFIDYVLFVDKCEREILATKNRTPFFESRYTNNKSPALI